MRVYSNRPTRSGTLLHPDALSRRVRRLTPCLRLHAAAAPMHTTRPCRCPPQQPKGEPHLAPLQQSAARQRTHVYQSTLGGTNRLLPRLCVPYTTAGYLIPPCVLAPPPCTVHVTPVVTPCPCPCPVLRPRWRTAAPLRRSVAMVPPIPGPYPRPAPQAAQVSRSEWPVAMVPHYSLSLRPSCAPAPGGTPQPSSPPTCSAEPHAPSARSMSPDQ